MTDSRAARATAAAVAAAASLGLDAEEGVVLHASNKYAVRLRPCDVLARVAPVEEQVAEFELDVAGRLAAAGAPVAEPLAPARVHEEDGFTVAFWTYYEPAAPEVPPAEYAAALERLHAGMRGLDVPTPHFTDRVAEALAVVADRDVSPGLPEADRRVLVEALELGRSIAARGSEQVLHGEPHPGNLLATTAGPRFIDFETCCRGPVEFDLAHAPDAVAAHYRGADPGLLRECRIVMLAMITAWRWDPADRFPDGMRFASEKLAELRTELTR
ncbi:phosphotransferase enzyme family protein [Glycomyces mayteni]|uniref:Phosphotransferase enzyme family protein n=1 Tax=Glycomyces mayteni TaxID=543887 RepID=A0ABW2D6H5_9ACTN|nr:aminoglycoside phosphotransferase [Glycomyces mayteni]